MELNKTKRSVDSQGVIYVAMINSKIITVIMVMIRGMMNENQLSVETRILFNSIYTKQQN